MRSSLTPLLVAFALVAASVAGCGGSGEPSTKVGKIEVTGQNTDNLGVGTTIAEHINRGCKRDSVLNYATFGARVTGPDSVSRSLRSYYLLRYGNLLYAYQSLLERCATYTSIDVTDDEITVKTSLGNRRIDVITADDTCKEIAASNAAESTPGRVLDAMGDVLTKCRAPTA